MTIYGSFQTLNKGVYVGLLITGIRNCFSIASFSQLEICFENSRWWLAETHYIMYVI